MSKQKPEPKPDPKPEPKPETGPPQVGMHFQRLGMAIGLPASQAETRVRKLPQGSQKKIADEVNHEQANDMRIRAVFDGYCAQYDRDMALEQKATDAAHDHLDT